MPEHFQFKIHIQTALVDEFPVRNMNLARETRMDEFPSTKTPQKTFSQTNLAARVLKTDSEPCKNLEEIL